ncbi:hypothetical protein F4779DRAFT_626040 [Xylariaceae sp. FL0662B]|nr:hypothetical protein F4779DRAFT_626040 [Xylariaceae sp. FL0662B]
MDTGPPESKRPRLSAGTSWSSHQSVSLPHPAAAHHPPASSPHHPAPPPPYQAPPPFSRPPEPPLSSAHHHLDDRRHHEHDPYPPIHDPHRQPLPHSHPPPSSAHPPFSPYPPRDPVVKRDPAEETSLPQLRRPNSTGNAVDGLPPVPHGSSHPNHQPPEDPRRHMSYDSGPPMPHSPALYRQPPQSYHPPPTPVAQHHQYESAHVYGATAPMYPTLEIQASTKRKAQRASQACDSCRHLKAKCDETKPCKNCREKNVPCKYRDPPAKQPDKVSTDILELLTTFKDDITNKIDRMEERLNSLAGTVLRQSNSGIGAGIGAGIVDMKVESIEGEDRSNLAGSPVPVSNAQAEEAPSSPGETVPEPSLTKEQAEATLQDVDDDEMEASPGPPVDPGRPAMPQNHTTFAGLLLKWRSIEDMVKHLLQAERIYHPDEFPIRQEQQRGLLRVFGRGEGFDQDFRSSDYNKDTPQDHTGMTDAGDGFSDSVESPGPMGDVWGQVGSLTPPRGVDYKGGVINVEGNPDWDSAKVWKYVQSFRDNILNMHPIIIPKELNAQVKLFLERLPRTTSNQSNNTKVSSNARFVNQPSSVPPSIVETGMKRKRSPAADEQSPSASFQKPGRPYRSIQNALVLLVFALGKVCLHKDKIPDPISDSDPPTHNSPSVRNGVLASPLQGSPPGLLSQSQSSGLPSPKEGERVFMSRRSSFQGQAPNTKGTHTHRRNLDVIPGLEYFAMATDILGSHIGGFNLKHVYVNILAGLYHGQLGRVLESWSYISLASRTLQVILRPSLSRLTKAHECGYGIGHSRRDNQLVFAFWTCLQLESDIIAELPLPQSGILQYEDRMPYPNMEYAINQGFSQEVVTGYIAQLYLRKQLNQVHNLLYDPAKQRHSRNALQDPVMEEGVKEIEAMLANSRDTWVPEGYKWKNDDPPADNILAARLRAKYWGSQVILYRPFLKQILENMTLPVSLYRDPQPPPNTWAAMGLNVGNAMNIPSGLDPRTLNYARLAINALIESTRAFHGIDKNQRIIITNVFGTAHAQWGNLLTLAACYRNSTLRPYVDPETLSTLFTRTISFFQMIVQPTSALATDMNILIGLAKDFGFIRDEFDAKADSSFSSMASSGPLPPMQQPNDSYSGPPSSVLGPLHLPPPPPPH